MTSPSSRSAFRSTIAQVLAALGVRLVLQQQLDVAGDRRERRAQLVRDARDELVLQPVELDELLVLVAQELLRLLGLPAREPLAAARALDGAHEPREPQQHEHPDRSRADRDRRTSATRWCAYRSTERITGADEQRRGEQREPRGREPRQPAPVGLGEPRHRRVERRRRPDDVRAEPERVDPVAALVARASAARTLVGDDPERDADEQQPVRGRAPARAEQQLRERRRATARPSRDSAMSTMRAVWLGRDVPVRLDEEHPLDERRRRQKTTTESSIAARLVWPPRRRSDQEDAQRRAAGSRRDRTRRRSTEQAAPGPGRPRRPRRSTSPATWPRRPKAKSCQARRRRGGRFRTAPSRWRRPTRTRSRRRRSTARARGPGAGSRRRSRPRRRPGSSRRPGAERSCPDGRARRVAPCREAFVTRRYSTLQRNRRRGWRLGRASLCSRRFP